MDRRDSAAQTVTTGALLSRQLDGVLNDWEREIATVSARPSGSRGPAPRNDPADLAKLERELDMLEREEADLRRQANGEARQVANWEGLALRAARDKRDDLVQQATHHREEHRDAAAALLAEATATAELAEAFRGAIGMIRAANPPRPR